MRDAPTQLGVYAHWPYCARLCPYCDFNIYRDRGVDAERWSAALVADLARWRDRTGPRLLSSLYFGGGTPSIAPPAVLQSVVDACARLWGFASDTEITIEANPGAADAARWRDFAAMGIDRLSLGVQALDDDALRFLGRDHRADEARRAIGLGLATFPRLSFDLIYARPGQTVDAWRRELDEALSLGARHLSLYQLTIEPGTAFGLQVARRRWSPLDSDGAADLFDLTHERAAAAGLPAYEVSNFAAPGAESRHNLLYWTYADWIGIGPGAHGRLSFDGRRIATVAAADPAAYLGDAERGVCGREENVSREAADEERISMGLRLSAGVPITDDDWRRLAGRAAPLIADGLLLRTEGRLIATPAGRRVLDSLLAALLA
ncbi:MAG: radical SAM family heme chaperone HemW [Parvularculaceae bacterium]|nr:radical SAM family heme chaperone HemW [Parvularculaceae bacterium]